MTARVAAARRRGQDWIFLSLTRDGRVADRGVLDRILARAREATDCFVFCHGWLYDEAEARREAGRFFALLAEVLAPLRERVVPLRVAVHWPSKPVAEHSGESIGETLLDALGRVPAALSCALLGRLCEAEVPEGPEEEAELDALRRRLASQASMTTASLTPVEGISFWLMKRRAGQVGARLGREALGAIAGAVRTHLIGHSFGGKLVAASVAAGARPESLTLLQAAFSAFAFAPDVPGFGRPGAYHAIVTEGRVRRPIAVLRSDHDRALTTLYALTAGGAEVVGRAGHGRPASAEVARAGVTEVVGDEEVRSAVGAKTARSPRLARGAATMRDGDLRRLARDGEMARDAEAVRSTARRRPGRARDVVATSAIGAVGARGVGAPELTLEEVQVTGLPRYPIVNIDGSAVVRAREPVVGAHRDIYHREVATLILLAAGLLEGGPDGARTPRRSPLAPA